MALKKVAQSPCPDRHLRSRFPTRAPTKRRRPTGNRRGSAAPAARARPWPKPLPIAQSLDSRNRERQKIEREHRRGSHRRVRAKFNPANDFVIVEGQLLWHIGVVGIVASRVLQEFYRPTIIIGGEGDGMARLGPQHRRVRSGRGVARMRRPAPAHGGHAMAAGLSIHSANLDAFRQRLNELARRALKPEDLQPPLRLDAEVGLDEMTVSTSCANSNRLAAHPAREIRSSNSAPATWRISVRFSAWAPKSST